MNVKNTLILGLFAATPVLGQSSSLYVQDTVPQRQQAPVAYSSSTTPRSTLAPALARASFTAVRMPEPKQFVINGLVTIIVREAAQNDSKANISTEKETKLEGEISEFPKLQLADLIEAQLGASTFSKGKPKLAMEFKKEFEGDGNFKRSDSFTTRLTAKIIDIKPNGQLVLEARRFMRTDKESVAITLTGTCRSEDIGADNSVLSTNLHDLRLIKEHEGDIRKATKKGILTDIFETLFAF